MGLLQLRVCVTAIATMTAIVFIMLSYIFKEEATLILSIEVILLPSIYIIGNYFIEHIIKEEFREQLSIVSDEVDELKDKYVEQLLINQTLKNKDG